MTYSNLDFYTYGNTYKLSDIASYLNDNSLYVYKAHPLTGSLAYCENLAFTNNSPFFILAK